MKKIIAVLIGTFLSMSLLSGCSSSPTKPTLSPNTPTNIQLWHYYNGQAKSAFDLLAETFNSTIGQEQGIVVSAFSQGDVNDLANAVLDSATKAIGAQDMPDIFAAYSDNIFRIEQLDMIASLNNYFTKEELSEYRQDFIDEGVFGKDNTLKILPVAKSTENIFVNKTDWDKFASETNADINSLATWEGLAKTAAAYYDWSDSKTEALNDGKALLGIDSMANFMIVSAKQHGIDIVTIKDGKPTFTLTAEIAKKIWDNFHIPFINGHYAAISRFRSDDAKTGDVLSYIGSTAGASYFPKQVTLGKDNEYPIECMTLPYPKYEGTDPIAIQQGAGMAIVKSNPQQELASAIFLKWFTDTPQNILFAAPTGYLPVKNEAIDFELIKEKMDNNSNISAIEVVTASTKTTIDMMETHTLYGAVPYNGSFDVRAIFEASLLEAARNDLEQIKMGIQLGGKKETIITRLTTQSRFDEWFTDFQLDINHIIAINK